MFESGKLVDLNVKVGDRVLFGKYSGTEATMIGTEYIVMDVLGIVDSKN